jgi:hypothetical protein
MFTKRQVKMDTNHIKFLLFKKFKKLIFLSLKSNVKIIYINFPLIEISFKKNKAQI